MGTLVMFIVSRDHARKSVTDNEEHVTPLKCDENGGTRILERRPDLS